MREKTGYYDRNGKEIRDGDKIKAIIGGQIFKGYVDERDGEWALVTQSFRRFVPPLYNLDDVEILEEE